MSKIGNTLTGILRHDSNFVDLMRTIMKLVISFQKADSKNFVATRVADNVRDMVRADFLTRMRSESYYRIILVAEMLL